MEKSTAFWESVVAIAPVLGLAVIVEIRLVQWHRFAILWRYAVGLLAGAVLTGLAVAVTVALGVLRTWDANRPVHDWQFEITYWAVYVGIISVLTLPVTQLWLVVFVDFSPMGFLLLLQIQHQKRSIRRIMKQTEGLIDELKETRRELQIEVAERILRNPAGVFSSTDGSLRVEVSDSFVLGGRRIMSNIDARTVEIEKLAKKRRKAFRRRERDELKKLGGHPKRAAQSLRRYQNFSR